MNPNQEAVGFGDSSKVGPPLRANNNAVDKVLANTLIWTIIGSYLNVGDLKACRLVSSGFHGMVMKETNFLQRCLVSLKPDQITKNVFGSTRELWKNVLLNFQSPGGEGSCCYHSDEDLKNLDWLYPVISNVESLSLRMKEGSKGENCCPLLIRLLNAPKKLRSLAMEPIFLIFGTAGHFWEETVILGNLEEFEILQPSPKWLCDIDWWRGIPTWLVSVDFIKYLGNLRVLKSYYPQRKLSASTSIHSATLRECEILTSVLTRIALVSTTTLKRVTLGEARPNENGVFPSPLFLDAMPIMLQELHLSVYFPSFPKEILNVIEEKSHCLRKVKLEGWNFQGTKWEFLKNTKLEEFQLGVPNSGHGSCTLPSEAQNYWPSTIRRLFMNGLLESNPVPALARLDPTLVTQITFIHSGVYFGDDAIKYICGNFVMLRTLNVTYVDRRVTDAGFIGCSSGLGSLAGIKGLRTLILRECGSITDATLKEIRFLELSYLDLSYNKNLTEDGLGRVLSNNPSLETLVTSCEDVYRKREQLRASHPRLSSNCALL